MSGVNNKNRIIVGEFLSSIAVYESHRLRVWRGPHMVLAGRNSVERSGLGLRVRSSVHK